MFYDYTLASDRQRSPVRSWAASSWPIQWILLLLLLLVYQIEILGRNSPVWNSELLGMKKQEETQASKKRSQAKREKEEPATASSRRPAASKKRLSVLFTDAPPKTLLLEVLYHMIMAIFRTHTQRSCPFQFVFVFCFFWPGLLSLKEIL